MFSNPVLVVHGGAWDIPDDAVDSHVNGVRNALDEGWKVLQGGGCALDAVEESVAAMEDDETFDAGRGSFLNHDGKVQLDALIMDGATLKAGGVGCVEHLRNPIRVARKILEKSPHIYLVAEGAERFAGEHGISLCKNEDLILPREIARLQEAHMQSQRADLFAGPNSHDTVGAVALDRSGNLAAATSTGGTLDKAPGRVGDSSLIGCGCYADNLTGAASTTGWGEAIMKLVLAKWATDRLGDEERPHQTARRAITYLQTRVKGFGGVILLDAMGRFGIGHNTPRMAWVCRTLERENFGFKSP